MSAPLAADPLTTATALLEFVPWFGLFTTIWDELLNEPDAARFSPAMIVVICKSYAGAGFCTYFGEQFLVVIDRVAEHQAQNLKSINSEAVTFCRPTTEHREPKLKACNHTIDKLALKFLTSI